MIRIKSETRNRFTRFTRGTRWEWATHPGWAQLATYAIKNLAHCETSRHPADWPESSVWGADLPGGPRLSPNAIGWGSK